MFFSRNTTEGGYREEEGEILKRKNEEKGRVRLEEKGRTRRKERRERKRQEERG
jgi:hypothetical protein